MVKKLGRIAICVTARSNYGRLQFVIKEARKYFDVKLILAVEGLWEEIKADEYISCLLRQDGTREMALTSGLLHIQMVNVLDRLKPDLVFVHGDRFEVLNIAQVAAYMNIPVCHTEGGELTGTIDDKVRYAITALADFHFVTTKLSDSRIHKPNVFVVGSTAIDNIASLKLKPKKGGFVLVLMHPNTTDPEPLEPLIFALKQCGLPVKWINPNVDAGSQHMLKEIYGAGFHITKGLTPKEYYTMLNECAVLVGNTSSGIKEAAWLGKPYVCIGTRQQGREHDVNTKFIQNDPLCIWNMITEEFQNIYERSYMFGDGTAGKQIIQILKDRL